MSSCCVCMSVLVYIISRKRLVLPLDASLIISISSRAPSTSKHFYLITNFLFLFGHFIPFRCDTNVDEDRSETKHAGKARKHTLQLKYITHQVYRCLLEDHNINKYNYYHTLLVCDLESIRLSPTL